MKTCVVDGVIYQAKKTVHDGSCRGCAGEASELCYKLASCDGGDEEIIWVKEDNPYEHYQRMENYIKAIFKTVPEDNPKDNDMVNQQVDSINPSHYKTGGIEAIDYMQAKSTPEEFQGHLRLTALKYLSRANDKHESPWEDYEKALWYVKKLCEQKPK